jgi:hypothetical protein
MCDWRSVDPRVDLVASDNVYTHTAAETYNVYYNPAHHWYYLNNMGPDETFVFKSYDSRMSNNTARGTAHSVLFCRSVWLTCSKVCPHAAFRDPLAPPDARPRESVECLAIVVYPESHDANSSQDEEEVRFQSELRAVN